MNEKRNRKSKKTNQMKEIWRRFRKSKTAMLGLCLLIFVLCIAIFADVITPYENAFRKAPTVWTAPVPHIYSAQTSWGATCLPALSMAPAIRC